MEVEEKEEDTKTLCVGKSKGLKCKHEENINTRKKENTKKVYTRRVED